MFEIIPMAVAESAPQEGGSGFITLIMFLGLFLFMWLFLFRPQKKQRMEHLKMIEGLKVGDEVVTSGGIMGVVKELKKSSFVLEVGEALNLRVQKQAVVSVLPKGTLTEEDAAD